MAITKDADSNGGVLSDTSLTVAHTCGATADFLLVAVSTFDTEFGGSPQTPTVTYNSVSMDQEATIVYNTDQRLTLFSLVDPDTGSSHNIVASLSGDADEIDLAAVSFIGVDGTTPLGTPVTEDAGGVTTVDNDVSSETGDLVVDAVACYNPNNLAIGSGQTEVSKHDGGSSLDTVVMSTEAGASTVTMSWDVDSSENFGHVVVNMNAASGGSPKLVVSNRRRLNRIDSIHTQIRN